MKKLITGILAAALAVSCAFSVGAAGASYEDYKAKNDDQKAYYNEVYRPVYDSYREAVTGLRRQIRDMKFESREQAQKVLAFLENLIAEHRAFYGDRTTVGLSRYEVPAAREAMYKAADEDKDYDTAIGNCEKLKALVVERVGFLQNAQDKVESFQPTAPQNGIAWLAEQLRTDGTVAHDYFSNKAGNTSLDSTGYNFAPDINTAMKAAIGIDANADASWRIYKCYDGTYNILWSYSCINPMAPGDGLALVSFYNTGVAEELSGTAAVGSKHVDNNIGGTADINIITGFTAGV